ncbi:MAG: acyl carrier protein [Deltaproteobacteria bacterium]|nr:acyl carrier protein [Deltaproteobacteria bacterium]MBP6830458.1 acyl carrier protein [Deltaproteobacteria bacterium]
MNDDEITRRLTDIFRSVFNQPGLEIARETTADTVRGWDSLKHVELMVSIEAGFGIRFKVVEIGRLRNVGDLIDKIRGKVA